MKSVENNAAQDGQLPLHYAAEKGVSLNLWKLLLKANPKAAATVDTACRCAPSRTATHTLCRRTSACAAFSFSLVLSQSPRHTNVLHCAPRVYAGGRAAPALRCRQ